MKKYIFLKKERTESAAASAISRKIKNMASELCVHGCRAEIEGTEHEKAVSLIINAGIRMEDIKYDDELMFSFVCSYSDYLKLANILGQRYMISLASESGVVPFIKRILRRVGLAAGTLLICIMLILQQNIITEIEIEGDYGTDERKLRSALYDAGLYEGCGADIDNDYIKNEVLNEFKNIRWMGIERQGTYVRVSVVEGSSGDGKNDSVIHDVIAAKSGYIERIIVRDGYALAEVGDYVQAGQMIISCLVPLQNTTYDTSRDNAARVADADGIVEATVVYHMRAEFPAGKYAEEDMKSVINDRIRKYIRENIPEYIKMHNKDLKFTQEENIIVCNVTLDVLENIAEQKENKLAENGSGKKTEKDNS